VSRHGDWIGTTCMWCPTEDARHDYRACPRRNDVTVPEPPAPVVHPADQRQRLSEIARAWASKHPEQVAS
jgi:hypothetical protein